MGRIKFKLLLLACALLITYGCGGLLTAVDVIERYSPQTKKGWVEFYSTSLDTGYRWSVYKEKDGDDAYLGTCGGWDLGTKMGFKTDELPGPATYIVSLGTGRSVVSVDIEEGIVKLVRVESNVTGTSQDYNTMTIYFNLYTVEGGSIPVARNPEALAKLKEALNHDDWGTRWYAAEALEEMAEFLDSETIENLKLLSRTDEQNMVRSAAFKAVQKWSKIQAKKSKD